MEDFKKDIYNILKDNDKERTALLRKFNALKKEQDTKECKSYSVFFGGMVVGAVLYFVYSGGLLWI